MLRFLVMRVLQALVVVIGVTIVVFVIIHELPGGPARALLGNRASPAAIRSFTVQNGYNEPLPVQYWRYVDQLVHGNLGYSYYYNENVSAILGQVLPKTALLVGLAYLVAIVIAIPVGMYQALHRNRPVDHALTVGSFVGFSMPTFWVGILLVSIFADGLRMLPSEAPQGTTVLGVLQDSRALILPVATLAIVSIAQFSRFMRSSALANLVQDFVRTAQAKGVSSWGVVWRHLLRNSLLPVITLIGLSFPSLFAGAIVVESLFNYPGMGQLLYTATTVHDYPVLMGFTVVVGLATVTSSLVADLLYATIDPRIRYR
jgi:peptide/nickel transport system permease protein